ncbi:unnamed protein product [Didymodactylos carnosus]|uniref:Uncharacterized protein n=2 Tax=Didymodactylos carnosus TaxID=1234261 RepID=A0A8S2G581_9BILA|nr:unnamed protein product [Didymodactylos carnosus]CAF4449583.1 unnamed protein product [Didymodactylos carnosus]
MSIKSIHSDDISYDTNLLINGDGEWGQSSEVYDRSENDISDDEGGNDISGDESENDFSVDESENDIFGWSIVSGAPSLVAYSTAWWSTGGGLSGTSDDPGF